MIFGYILLFIKLMIFSTFGYISVKLGELEEALDSFEKSLEMAKLQNDKMAENAIKQALDDVNNKIVRGIRDSDEKGKRT